MPCGIIKVIVLVTYMPGVVKQQWMLVPVCFASLSVRVFIGVWDIQSTCFVCCVCVAIVDYIIMSNGCRFGMYSVVKLPWLCDDACVDMPQLFGSSLEEITCIYYRSREFEIRDLSSAKYVVRT